MFGVVLDWRRMKCFYRRTMAYAEIQTQNSVVRSPPAIAHIQFHQSRIRRRSSSLDRSVWRENRTPKISRSPAILNKIRRLRRCFKVHEVWNLMYSSYSTCMLVSMVFEFDYDLGEFVFGFFSHHGFNCLRLCFLGSSDSGSILYFGACVKFQNCWKVLGRRCGVGSW